MTHQAQNLIRVKPVTFDREYDVNFQDVETVVIDIRTYDNINDVSRLKLFLNDNFDCFGYFFDLIQALYSIGNSNIRKSSQYVNPWIVARDQQSERKRVTIVEPGTPDGYIAR